MMRAFDTVVIGSGTAAYYCITALNKAGQRVAVADERPYGGTCALRGCQPKKYLVANAEAVAMAQHLSGIGLTDPPRTDWAALQALLPERIGEKYGGYKVLVSNVDDTILGAHIARHAASEVINTFALAIRHGIRAGELSEFLWAYPTYTSDLKYMVR